MRKLAIFQHTVFTSANGNELLEKCYDCNYIVTDSFLDKIKNLIEKDGGDFEDHITELENGDITIDVNVGEFNDDFDPAIDHEPKLNQFCCINTRSEELTIVLKTITEEQCDFMLKVGAANDFYLQKH